MAPIHVRKHVERSTRLQPMCVSTLGLKWICRCISDHEPTMSQQVYHGSSIHSERNHLELGNQLQSKSDQTKRKTLRTTARSLDGKPPLANAICSLAQIVCNNPKTHRKMKKNKVPPQCLPCLGQSLARSVLKKHIFTQLAHNSIS